MTRYVVKVANLQIVKIALFIRTLVLNAIFIFAEFQSLIYLFTNTNLLSNLLSYLAKIKCNTG